MSRTKGLILLLSSLLPYLAGAQTAFNVYNDGMTEFVLESGIEMTIYGGYVSQTNGTDGVIDNQSVIRLTGDWLNNNTGGANPFTTGTGTIELVGSAEQTVGGTVTTYFNDLVVNNTAASGGVTVTRTIYVANSLTLTDGVVTTSSGNTVVMQAGSTSNEGSAASFVSGPMRKEGNTAYVFPLGNNGVWARLAIGATSSISTFEARYYFSPFSDVTAMASSPTPVLNNVSKREYWNLTREAGTGTVPVTIYWENAARSDINNCPDLKLARWSGGGWENTFNTSGSGNCAGTGAGTISSGASLQSYVGPLTFGSLLPDPTNPLPIELVLFSAELQENGVNLSWVTASEMNNDYFTVEKSQDGFVFKPVVEVDSRGNSTNEVHYTALDRTPYVGFSYYRLKQTDLNGEFEYSDLVVVRNDREIKTSIYPNPLVGNSLYLSMDSPEGQEVLITVFDSMGAIVHTQTIVQELGATVARINLPNLQSGLYVVIGSSNQELFREKLLINR